MQVGQFVRAYRLLARTVMQLLATILKRKCVR